MMNGKILGKFTVIEASQVGSGTEIHDHVVIKNSEIGKDNIIWSLVNIFASKIGHNNKIGSLVEIGGSQIGSHCKIEAFAYIPAGTKIGNRVFIAPKVCLANDKYPHADPIWELGNVEIQDNCSIGIACVILPNVTIGKNSFVAASSLVTKSIPPYSFAMGRPASCVSREVFKKTVQWR